jgi:hypothetical protein
LSIPDHAKTQFREQRHFLFLIMSTSRAEPMSEQPIPTHADSERHSESGAIVRDMTIGFADGMTVPFALTAGLSSLGSSKLVIIGGLAELFSGSISMGLGAYLAAVTDRDHYKSEEAREREEISTKPGAEKEECHEILASYGVSREASQSVVECLSRDNEQWIRVCVKDCSQTKHDR